MQLDHHFLVIKKYKNEDFFFFFFFGGGGGGGVQNDLELSTDFSQFETIIFLLLVTLLGIGALIKAFFLISSYI